MRHILPAIVTMYTFLLTVSLIAAAGQDKDKGVPAKKVVVEGTWKAAKVNAKADLLIFAGNTFALTATKGDKSENVTGTFKLTETSTHVNIDMTVTGGNGAQAEKYKGKTSLGIVKVDGDKLEWCANEPGKDVRPKLFAAKDGDAKYLYVAFERVKK